MYYALFKETSSGVEVSFPDAPSAITCGNDMEEAMKMAIDVLSAILATGTQGLDFYPPRPYSEISKLAQGELVFPVLADESIIESYRPKERINIMADRKTLAAIDQARAEARKTRSDWLMDAARAALTRSH